MDLLLVATAVHLGGLVAFLVSSVRAGRIRDPRDADGRRLPLVGDEERRARRVQRIGTAVLAACLALYAAAHLTLRPQLTGWYGAIAAGAIAVGAIAWSVRRRRGRRASAADAPRPPS